MGEKRTPLYAQIAEMRKLYDIARQDLAAAQAENEKLRAELAQCRKSAEVTERLHDGLMDENEKLLEALEPSAATKHAYIGEFYFDTEIGGYDEDGEHTILPERVQVPWTTIKEIMAAIRARAAAPEPAPDATESPNA